MKNLNLITILLILMVSSCTKESMIDHDGIEQLSQIESTEISTRSGFAFCNNHGSFYTFNVTMGILMGQCQYFYVFDLGGNYVGTWLRQPADPGTVTVTVGTPNGVSFACNPGVNNREYCSLLQANTTYKIANSFTYNPSPDSNDFNLFGSFTTAECRPCSY